MAVAGTPAAVLSVYCKNPVIAYHRGKTFGPETFYAATNGTMRWIYIPKGHTLGWHRHNKEERLMVLEGRGSGVVSENNAEGPCQILKPGTVWRVEADAYHMMGADSDGPLVLVGPAGDYITEWKEPPKKTYRAPIIAAAAELEREFLLAANLTPHMLTRVCACLDKHFPAAAATAQPRAPAAKTTVTAELAGIRKRISGAKSDDGPARKRARHE